jgi:uncharacterized membrane-anchored protein
MSMHLDDTISSAMLISIFVAATQITAKSFHPFQYRTAVSATTTAGMPPTWRWSLEFLYERHPTLLLKSVFVLTRPPCAIVDDLVNEAHAQAGLALSHFHASAIFAALIVACIRFLPLWAGRHTISSGRLACRYRGLGQVG